MRRVGPTSTAVKYIDKWMADKKWDVIHFNWGLHDMKYVDQEGKRTSPENGRPQVPIEQYEQNLEELVKHMKKTGAALIFATTTPVPEGASGRIAGDAKKYNEVAMKIMKKHNVIINDLYSLALPHLKEIQKKQECNPGSSLSVQIVVAGLRGNILQGGRIKGFYAFARDGYFYIRHAFFGRMD